MNYNYRPTSRSPALSLQTRFAYYVQSAVSQGAFTSLAELLERFLKTIHKKLHERQKRRYFAYIKTISEAFGLRICYQSGTRKQKTFVTSSTNSILGTSGCPYPIFLTQLKRVLKSSKNASISVYEALYRTTNASRPTLERYIRHLKEKAEEYGLCFFKVGKKLLVKFSKNTHQTPATHYYIKAKELLRNTPKGTFRFKPSIRGKAFWLARQLKGYFYDNIKVKFNLRMAYRYAEWSLTEGFHEKDIRGAFYEAVIQRHKDATDMGLNQGCPTLKFELSSTVSMAYKLLKAISNKSAESRWKDTKEKLEKSRLKKTTKQSINNKNQFSDITLSRPTFSKLATDPYSTQFILATAGFSSHQIRIYEQYKSQKLSTSAIRQYSQLLGNCRKHIGLQSTI